ncbi:MAG: CPBP family intramembrane metalloprotease [Thermoplasmatales archaeon]|nr:CPBP family intramembrane metalloprotease [Thermoplasmatales archaeon]
MSKIEYLKIGLRTVCLTAVICYFIMLLFSFLLLFPSLIIVSPELLSSSWDFFIITPYMIPVFSFKEWFLLGYYLFVVSAILLSFIYIVKKEGKEAFHLYSKFFEKTERNSNSFFLIPQIFLGLMFFDYAYDYIIRFIHVTPKTPSFGTMPLWQFMFSLSNASVHEEIVSRILLIGMPLLLVDLFRRRKIKIWKYFLGGGFDIEPASLFFIIFSSLIFSYAHVFGWDFYKILPVFVTGVALGWLFLKKGIYACIILHFSFNYPSVLLRVLEKLPTSAIIIVPIIFFLSVLIVTWIVACPFYFLKYTYKIIKGVPKIFKPGA